MSKKGFFRRNKAHKAEKIGDSENGVYGIVPDISELAREAVRAGLIGLHVLEHLTSLNPQVPTSMKHRYLLIQLLNTISQDDELLTRMVQVFLKFRSHPLYTPGSVASTSSAISGDDFPLHSGDIPDLAELLVPYASHWRSIGTALRFKPQDLDNIQACQQLVPNSPDSYLLKLLENWILGHAIAPTLNGLEKALRSRIVGLGNLAQNVRSCLRKNPDLETEALLPYYKANIHVGLRGDKDDLQVTTSQNTDRIGAKENETVLLEIQVGSAKTLTLQYQWLKNGQPLSDGTKSILCLSNIDIDMDDSVYACEVTINGRQKHTTTGVTLRVHCPLDQYASSLTSMYSAQPEVPEDTWPPVSSKKHISLALIKQEQPNYGAEYAIRGDIEDILQNKQRIEYDDVIKSLKNKRVLFIEGRQGCGKTTFVHKITREWAIASLGAIRLVLLVSLRVLNTLNKPDLDLADILRLFKDLKVTKKNLEQRNGKGVCFIFDGLDEFSPPDGKNSMVYKIILKKYLTESSVIVASGPAAIAELRSRANEVIEVLGFQNKQILEYFDQYPFSVSSKAEDLKAYLRSHPNILHMCYLPIHAAMVGFLFERTGKVPTTETEIYKHFTQLTILRSLSKTRDIADIDIQNLNQDEEKLFYQICKLAFEKTILNKQVLHQDEVKSYFLSKKDGDISLGLITVDRTADLYGFKDTYTFLHLTFQEYLAANHISTLSDEEQCKIIEEHGHKNHMLVVWKFYCGLVKFSTENNTFKSILDKTSQKSLFHIQCAYESQQLLPCTQLPCSLVFNEDFLTTSDCTAIGYVLSKSELFTNLSIIRCNFKHEAVVALTMQTKERKLSLQNLTFHFRNFSITEVKCLSHLLVNFYCLKGLNLRIPERMSSESFTASHKALSNVLIYSANLEYLDLSDNDLGDPGAKIMASSLTVCRKLKRLNISWNNISTEGAAAIFESVKQCNLLVNYKDLTIGNKLTCGTVAHVLQYCTNLQSLEIAFDIPEQQIAFDIPDQPMKEERMRKYEVEITSAIAHSIQDHFHELHTILLDDFRVDGGAAESLAEGLSKCPKLQVLNLSNSRHLQTAGIEAIAASIISCTNLDELYLNNCGIDCERATALSLSLKHYQNIRMLSLQSNRIDSVGAQALAGCLKHCPRLKNVDLHHNRISEEEEKLIFSSLYVGATSTA